MTVSRRLAPLPLLLIGLAALAALLLSPSVGHAQSEGIPTLEVPSDWSLIPSGLGVVDSFRLIFRSSTNRNAESADIAVHNSSVQDLAAAGRTDIHNRLLRGG